MQHFFNETCCFSGFLPGKQPSRINPDEVVKIIEENFDVYSRVGAMSPSQAASGAEKVIVRIAPERTKRASGVMKLAKLSKRIFQPLCEAG
jgi:hypothetical protein